MDERTGKMRKAGAGLRGERSGAAAGAGTRAELRAGRGGAGARRLRWALAALAAAAAVCALAAVLMLAQASTAQQGAASVRQAVLSAATQCAAVEGAYPSTIEHLEQYYGLSVNHNDYVINYEAYASNVMPSVTVVPR